MDRFINFKLWNVQNFILVLFSIVLLTLIFHLFFKDKVKN